MRLFKRVEVAKEDWTQGKTFTLYCGGAPSKVAVQYLAKLLRALKYDKKVDHEFYSVFRTGK